MHTLERLSDLNRQVAKSPRQSAKRRLGFAFGDRSRRRECEQRLASLTPNSLEFSGAVLGSWDAVGTWRLGDLAVQIRERARRSRSFSEDTTGSRRRHRSPKLTGAWRAGRTARSAGAFPRRPGARLRPLPRSRATVSRWQPPACAFEATAARTIRALSARPRTRVE